MSGDNEHSREVSWAIVRMILGLTQIVGATASFILLIASGLNRLTYATVTMTTVVTILSRILFSHRASRVGSRAA